MNREKFLKALEEQDSEVIQEEMLLVFEEKLEKKIWKIYKAIENDLKNNSTTETD